MKNSEYSMLFQTYYCCISFSSAAYILKGKNCWDQNRISQPIASKSLFLQDNPLNLDTEQPSISSWVEQRRSHRARFYFQKPISISQHVT